MSVKIRLKRTGRRNRPFYKVVAVDSKKKRDGRVLEIFGSYDPRKKEDTSLDVEKIKKRIANGAILSERVKRLIKGK